MAMLGLIALVWVISIAAGLVGSKDGAESKKADSASAGPTE